MKKTILALMMVALSVGVFAEQGNGNGRKFENKNKMERMENRKDFFLKDLSNEQKLEFKKLHAIHRKEMKGLILDIKSVNIEIEKMILNEKENSPELKKILDKKSALKSDKEYKAILFRKEIKTKFGIELPNMREHKKGRMGNKERNHQKGEGRKINCQ